MKKYLTVFALFVLTLILAGCGQKDLKELVSGHAYKVEYQIDGETENSAIFFGKYSNSAQIYATWRDMDEFESEKANGDNLISSYLAENRIKTRSYSINDDNDEIYLVRGFSVSPTYATNPIIIHVKEADDKIIKGEVTYANDDEILGTVELTRAD